MQDQGFIETWQESVDAASQITVLTGAGISADQPTKRDGAEQIYR